MAEMRSDDELREELKKYRGAQAYKRNCPPFKIFTNDLLEILVQEKPSTIEKLSMTKGFGEKRVAAHGQAIIDIINKSNMKQSKAF